MDAAVRPGSEQCPQIQDEAEANIGRKCGSRSRERAAIEFGRSTQPGHNGSNAFPIRAVLISESSLQFRIFETNHERTGHNRESREEPADSQAGAGALGQHLAQMSQIDGMPYARPYPRCNQPAVVVLGADFR